MSGGSGLTVLVMAAGRGTSNPYVELFTEGLRAHDVRAIPGDIPLLFPLTRAVVANPDVDVVQLDWLYSYYVTDDTDWPTVNALVTFLRALTFVVDLFVLSWLDVAVVRTVHNTRHHDGKYPRTGRLMYEAAFLFADAVLVKCHRAVDILREEYRLLARTGMHVIPDGSYVDAYPDDVSRADARESLGIGRDEFTYLYFGLIRPYKGVQHLVERYRDLDLEDATLWLVGKPATERLAVELRELTEDCDDIEPVFEFVPDERVQYYMHAADVLVLPYRKVLNSGAAHLGLSFGLPVVAPAIGCLPETLPPKNDLLYDPTRPGGLGVALQRAHNHPDLDGIGAANYETACERPWTEMAAEVLAVYRRCRS